jgi:hypothetical protein
MFSLTIVFGPGPMVWTLMYKSDEKARAHRNFLFGTDDRINLIDDFGQEASLTRAEIHGAMLEDMEQSKLAHIERELHLVRTKLKANEIADADPQIRQARRNQQGGMPMLQPIPAGMPGLGPNGRFPS